MFVKFKSKVVFLLMIIITFIFFPSSVKAVEIKFDLNNIFENHRLVRMIIDIESGDVKKVNKAALEFYGYSEEELLSMNITQINTLSPDLIRKELDAAASERRNFFNFKHRLASGEIKDVEVHSYPFMQNDKQYLYSIIIDKTEAVTMAENLKNNQLIIAGLGLMIIFMLIVSIIYLFKNKEKYKKMSYYDQLTKVFSRHYLESWQKNKVGNIGENSNNTAIVLLDIDCFKYINDKYGHIIGDRVLIEVANILKNSLREIDSVVRYGGDEFLLILENTSRDKTEEIMKRIQSQFLSRCEFEFSIEISYGIELLKDKVTIFDAIKVADQKMYKMKNMNNPVNCQMLYNINPLPNSSEL